MFIRLKVSVTRHSTKSYNKTERYTVKFKMATILIEGELPEKNVKRLTVYLSPDIHAIVEEMAEEDKRSLSQMAAILIERAIKQTKK